MISFPLESELAIQILLTTLPTSRDNLPSAITNSSGTPYDRVIACRFASIKSITWTCQTIRVPMSF